MLDLDDPMTQHCFRAAGLMSGLTVRGQHMSVSPSAVRAGFLTECLPLFAELRELASNHFREQAAFMLRAIDDYEVAIRELAGLGAGQITEDRRDGTGTCPVCGTAVTSRPEYQIVLCPNCDKPFMDAHHKLDSTEGFATWMI